MAVDGSDFEVDFDNNSDVLDGNGPREIRDLIDRVVEEKFSDDDSDFEGFDGDLLRKSMPMIFDRRSICRDS